MRWKKQRQIFISLFCIVTGFSISLILNSFYYIIIWINRVSLFCIKNSALEPIRASTLLWGWAALFQKLCPLTAPG